MIYEFTPFASDKLYGKALNAHISLVPNDDDWVVIRDRDTMYMTSDSGQIIEQATKDHPDCDLFTCATNRSWGYAMSNEADILKHHSIAQNRPTIYSPVKGIVPAFFWMFKKSLWKQHSFDDLPIISKHSFDARWTRNRKWKVLRIEHLYVFHYYRLHKYYKNHQHLL